MTGYTGASCTGQCASLNRCPRHVYFFFPSSLDFFSLLFHLHSSPVSIETIQSVSRIPPQTHASETCLNFTGSHSPEFRFMCSIVSFYGIIYNSTFEKPSAPFPTPSIRFAFVVLPLSIFSFFLLSARDPISQSIHSRRSYELQITASRFMRSLIV